MSFELHVIVVKNKAVALALLVQVLSLAYPFEINLISALGAYFKVIDLRSGLKSLRFNIKLGECAICLSSKIMNVGNHKHFHLQSEIFHCKCRCNNQRWTLFLLQCSLNWAYVMRKEVPLLVASCTVKSSNRLGVRRLPEHSEKIEATGTSATAQLIWFVCYSFWWELSLFGTSVIDK